MDKIEYIKFLESLSRRALEDYLENIWKEKIDINEAQEKWLTEYIQDQKWERAERYVKIFILLVALLSAVPIPDPTVEQKHIRLEGAVPRAIKPPGGCRFHTRCPRRDMLPDGGKICETEVPPWREVHGDHRIFCHIPTETLLTFEPVISQATEEA